MTHYLLTSNAHIKPPKCHTPRPRILELARRQRLLSAADLRSRGWSPQLLLKLHRGGQLQCVTRGLYSLPDSEMTEHQSLVEICRRVPKAVICLLSALQVHEVGTQLPHEVWIALPEATQRPAIDYPALRIARLRGDAYSEGIETIVEHGSTIRVYSHGHVLDADHRAVERAPAPVLAAAMGQNSSQILPIWPLEGDPGPNEKARKPSTDAGLLIR